ncbi:10864_t:CDS:2, partial [Racocetra persica]
GQNTLTTYQQQAQQLQQSQQNQQLQVQPVTQVQPVQQTANQWVDNARYNNGISGYTATPNRQGYYNTQQGYKGCNRCIMNSRFSDIT